MYPEEIARGGCPAAISAVTSRKLGGSAKRHPEEIASPGSGLDKMGDIWYNISM